MNTTEPVRPDREPLITAEEREIYTERLKTLETGSENGAAKR